jgi:hypothetical protein
VIEGTSVGEASPGVSQASRATQPESMTMPAIRPPVETAIKEAAAAGADAAARYAATELPAPPRLARPVGPPTPAAPTVKMVSAPPSPPAVASQAPARPARPAGTPVREPPPPPVPAASRYAITRPASIFGQARPLRGKSVFGDDVVSDKSLDEVILSYLAAELENDKK